MLCVDKKHWWQKTRHCWHYKKVVVKKDCKLGATEEKEFFKCCWCGKEDHSVAGWYP